MGDLFNRYATELSPGGRGGRWEIVTLTALGRNPAFQILAGSIDGADMAEWRDVRLKAVQPATVNRELNLISAVFHVQYSNGECRWQKIQSATCSGHRTRNTARVASAMASGDDHRISRLGWGQRAR